MFFASASSSSILCDKNTQKRCHKRIYIYIIYTTDIFTQILYGVAGSEVDADLQSMQVGSVMRKVKSRTWKKQRYFRLQDDCATIWYKSKKAGNAQSTCKLSWLGKNSFSMSLSLHTSFRLGLLCNIYLCEEIDWG